MRLREEKIDSLSKQLYQALRDHPEIELNAKDVRIFLEMKRVITEDLKREDEIDNEVRRILEKHRDKILIQNLDYTYLFKKAKEQIIKERGLVL